MQSEVLLDIYIPNDMWTVYLLPKAKQIRKNTEEEKMIQDK